MDRRIWAGQRDVIQKLIPNQEFKFLPDDVLKNAISRYTDYKKEAFTPDQPETELLDFVDFYDLSKILNIIGNIQTSFNSEELLYITNRLEKLSGCRNRVCHSRPLEPNDFSDLLDFTYELLKRGNELDWKGINEALSNINNPKYALSLDIPDYWKAEKRSIYNNLPLPEFDDTGFMGRKNDRDSINKLLLSNTKVISIVGEGGIGKTALAQRCLYDILEICESKVNQESMFDIIVWVSLKTKKLTSNGIEQIRDAINSSSGLFHEVSNSLIGNVETNSALDEINEYMKEFKVLLCIDNLETISNSDVREFLANFHSNSKILITTRIGLGEIEYRYKLDKLDDKSSIDLVRSLSKLLNLSELVRKNNDSIKGLCKKLYNNPLLIKWYVLGLASGKQPSELMGNNAISFKEAIKFCFENLYDQLDPTELNIIAVIACLRRPVTAVELRFQLDNISDIEIQNALHQLHNSSMLVALYEQAGRSQRLYSLTDIAEEYITSVRPVSNEIYQKVKTKKEELQKIIEADNIQKTHYAYDINSIFWSTRDEKICSIYLKKALIEYKKGNFIAAENYVSTAKGLMPDFSECYRIHASILREFPFKAESEYEKALEYNPDSSITRYAYAQFLIAESEFSRALEQIDAALQGHEDEISLNTCKAWILTLKGDFKTACKIYEKIIPPEAEQLKKFRVSTYDQALECFRRLGEQLFRDKDTAGGHDCLSRAIEIAKHAMSANDYDKRIISKICRILGNAESCGDSGLVNEIFKLIENYNQKLPVSDLQTLRMELENFGNSASVKHKSIAQDLINRMDPIAQKTAHGRIIGQIDKVIDQGKGASYGFINGNDGIRYFFHRNELNPNYLLDTKHYLQVSFSPGKNNRGYVALDIKEHRI